MSERRLTPWQRTRLRRQLHQTRDARVLRRTLAVLEYSQGRSITAIARMLGRTRQSVYNWVDAYTQDHDPAALHDEDRAGRPSLWTEDLRAILQTLLGQAPDQWGYFAVNWTVPLLQEQIEHSTEQRLSEDTIHRELQRLGYVWKRGRYALDPDPEREKKTLDSPVGSRPAAPERRARGG
ncbi:MAG: helix-turn-helix domain-containing protein [Acidobacteria bacterium]|nr:helix-turn-helix domain-containing protein [Acidobacteriota bacterium]